MTIRLAHSDELAELNALVDQSVRQLSAGYNTPAQIDSALRYMFGIDTQLIADGTYYVAETADHRLLGCGGWSQRRTLYGGDQSKTAPDPLLDATREPARIRAFFVHPDWARQGIGRAIITVCEATARQADFRELALAATLPGEPLYRALGYAAGERTTIPFPGGQALPIVLMHKTLI